MIGKTLRDKFQKSGRFKTQMWIALEEMEIILSVIEKGDFAAIYESGTCHGYSSSCMAEAVGDIKIHTFDPVDRDKVWEEVPEKLKKKIVFYTRKFNSYAPDIVVNRPDAPCFFFIDGDHRYSGVRRDWRAIRPFLRDGDVVAFHDVDMYSVSEAVKWIEKRSPTLKKTELYDQFRRHIKVLYYGPK